MVLIGDIEMSLVNTVKGDKYSQKSLQLAVFGFEFGLELRVIQNAIILSQVLVLTAQDW